MLRFALTEIAQKIELWLTTGAISADILADNFRFISPFWQGNNKTEFLEKFLDSAVYIQTSLTNITQFDPIIKFKSIDDDQHFAIILQYKTKNGSEVYEAVLGTVDNGLLVELRSIYDLNETKKAHNLR